MKHAAMNKFYRIVWNAAFQCWQAVSETARGKGKSSRGKSGSNNYKNKAAVLISSLLIMPIAMAEPTGGNVTAGQGNIQQSGTITTITQQSSKLAIDWNTFSINAQESVNFIQPTTSSIALNRVTGGESSSILGSLTANGQVWILNPNGVLFGNTAQVNVGGFVASTLNLRNEDFMAGKYSFSGSSGTVENRGVIKVPAGGIVALLAPVVKNNGSILATQGNVLLAATDAVTLQPEGSSLSYTIDRGALNALAENGGLIQAEGGKVVLTAAARDSLAKSVTNNTGIIEANTVQNRNGTILLLGDMQNGTVSVAGTLSAAAPNGGDGGFIETSAAHVKVADGSNVSTRALQGKTGQWLIDPADFTIATSGGDITGTQLGNNLGFNNVTIQSTTGSIGNNGDVNVNDTVSWSANKLTLNAQNNININSILNGSATAQIALEYGQGALAAGNTSDYYVKAPVNLSAGNNFSTKLGSDGTVVNYTVITDLGAPSSTNATDLQGMQGNLAGRYALGSNIDASATGSGSVWGTAGFSPVGNRYSRFTGNLDGLGHTITQLTINRPNQEDVGLFGQVIGGQVRNLGLEGGSVTGSLVVGGLVGYNGGIVTNVYSTGSVSGSSFIVGGLVGSNDGILINAYSTCSVSGTDFTGGLVGLNYGTVSNAYATGSVSGRSAVGGFVGGNPGTIAQTYAMGSVNGNDQVGGLVGLNQGTLINGYSTGSVSGTSGTGGLVGVNFRGNVNTSFWDEQTSGQITSAGGTGLTTAQMQTTTNFIGFNFTTTTGATGNSWVMVDTDGTLNNAGGAAGGTYPILASEYSTTIDNPHQLQLMAMNLSGNYTQGKNIDAAATGTTGDVWSGSTFIPVGNYSTKFAGTFDGLGHSISNITINQSGHDYVGLFGAVDTSSSIRKVGLVGAVLLDIITLEGSWVITTARSAMSMPRAT